MRDAGRTEVAAHTGSIPRQAAQARWKKSRKQVWSYSRKRWIKVLGALALSTGIHTFHRAISRPVLDRLVLVDDDGRVVLLFVRLRSLLFELCPDHPVVRCEACRRAYTPEQLGTEFGNRCHLCRQCGADLTESLVAHARTCRNLAPPKPLARMTPVSGSTIPPAASERFAARRNIRLGLERTTRVRTRLW